MKILIAIVIIIGSASCQKQSLSKEEMTKIVKERNDRLAYLFIKGDADSLALMYTSEAKLSLNGYDFVNGRNSIHQLWKEDMINSKSVLCSTKPTELSSFGITSTPRIDQSNGVKTINAVRACKSVTGFVEVWLARVEVTDE